MNDLKVLVLFYGQIKTSLLFYNVLLADKKEDGHYLMKSTTSIFKFYDIEEK